MYGCKHEKDAKEMYAKTLAKDHGNFKVARSKPVVNSAYPFSGASPDEIISCDFCGKGVREIKCHQEYIRDKSVQPRIHTVNHILQK